VIEHLRNILEKYKRHYQKKIKRDGELLEWIESHPRVKDFRDLSLKEQIAAIIHDVDIRCNNSKLRKFLSINKGFGFCDVAGASCECLNSFLSQRAKENIQKRSDLEKQQIKAKTQVTNLKKYGKVHHFQNPIIREKIKQTNLKKYGEEFASKNEYIKKKIEKTVVDKYKETHISKVKEFQNKKKQTNLKKYGVDHHSKNIDIKQKIIKNQKQTFLEKYGVDHNWKAKIVRYKIKQTNLKKYGVEFASQSTCVKQKKKKKTQEKYGVDTIFQIPEIKNKIISKNISRYGKPYPFGSDIIKEKSKQTNLKKYGTIYPTQNFKVKEKIRYSNIKKYGVDHYTKKHINMEILSKINDVEWLKHNHHDLEKPIFQIANEIGVSATYLTKIFHEKSIPIKLFQKSVNEKNITDFIKTLNLSLETNNRTLIPPLELDIFVPEKHLAIEYCGLYWHSETSANKPVNYHLNKLKLCNEKNIRLITIFSDEWENKQEIVKNRLKHILGFSDRICLARETEIYPISSELYRSFVDQHHIQGSIASKIKLGAFYQNQLVAAMGLGARRRNLGAKNSGPNDYEMLRFCTKGHVPGIGGKLFKYFVSNYSPHQVISYADRRWGEGEFYRHLGFEFVESTGPSYFYTNDYKKRHNRFAFRKDVIVRELKGDANKTEWENMQTLGYDRIWDCGTNKWIWNR